MNEEEIKKLRHSFTNPYREDLPATRKNQFGHTILGGEDTTVDTSDIEVKIDDTGQIKADLKYSIIDSPKVSEWVNKVGLNGNSEMEYEEEENKSRKIDVISSLLDELDEMDGSKKTYEELSNVDKQNTKKCANKDCQYSLPRDANFCLKCGVAQMKKFCSECGFNFKSEEKFCPDCGTKR